MFHQNARGVNVDFVKLSTFQRASLDARDGIFLDAKGSLARIGAREIACELKAQSKQNVDQFRDDGALGVPFPCTTPTNSTKQVFSVPAHSMPVTSFCLRRFT